MSETPQGALFKKFKPDEDIHKKENLKTSAARKIKKDLQEAYPSIEGNIDEFFPKKETMIVYKTRDYMEFLVVNGEIYFFRYRNGPFLPTLRLVHKFPHMMKKVQVDRGAIPHVLRAAPIMAVGITSKGGKIFEEIEEEEPVAVFAEGKEHAAAVGLTAMSTKDMVAGVKRGCGVDSLHILGDGLWNNYKVSL